MLSRAVYEPFDRVWVKMDGYDWWPARIVSDAELDASAQRRPEGLDLTVLFYGGTTTPASLEHFDSATANIAFFETASERAAAADEDRAAAIRQAERDETANALRREVAGAAGKAADSAAHGTAAKRTGIKRARSEDAAVNEESATGGGNFLPDNRLIAIAERIQSAVEAGDLSALRMELCDLDTISVTVRQLETTRVGVAVGSIVSKRELEKLWPLARALISSWARALPAETIYAIKRYQQCRLTRSGNDTTKTNTLENPMQIPLSSDLPSSKAIPSSSPTDMLPEKKEKSRTPFVHRIRKLLDNPNDPHNHQLTSDDFDNVAEEVCRDIVDPEDRKHLREVLEKPELVDIRRRLGTRALSGSGFLALSPSELMTDEEKRQQDERIDRKMVEEERVKMANVAITTLFKCPSCDKNRCSFHEQQTRSADEPTTKFLTCLECKHAWTTE